MLLHVDVDCIIRIHILFFCRCRCFAIRLANWLIYEGLFFLVISALLVDFCYFVYDIPTHAHKLSNSHLYKLCINFHRSFLLAWWERERVVLSFIVAFSQMNIWLSSHCSTKEKTTILFSFFRFAIVQLLFIISLYFIILFYYVIVIYITLSMICVRLSFFFPLRLISIFARSLFLSPNTIVDCCCHC